MKIYLATWLYEPGQGIALNKAGADSRLLSYYHTQDIEARKPGTFLTYTKEGTNENLFGLNSSKRRK